MARRYTPQNVHHSLQLLGQHLKMRHEEARIDLVGGAAWMLGYKIRKDVGDIDALWDNWSDMVLHPHIHKIAERSILLHPRWLNNDAQDVVYVPNGKWNRYMQFGGLEVCLPDDNTAAAMLVAALRCTDLTSNSQHPLGRYAQDLTAFAKTKNWTAAMVLAHAKQGYGDAAIPPICEEWVHRLLSKTHSSVQPEIATNCTVTA